jgi:hypothetical protein
MASIGHADALPVMRAAVNDKKDVVQIAAVKAMASWPTPDVMPDLIKLAESAPKPEQKEAALDGAIRMQRERKDVSAEQAVVFYTKALSLAAGDGAKKKVLAGLSEIADAKALALVEQCAKIPALAQEAAVAAEKINGRLKK